MTMILLRIAVILVAAYLVAVLAVTLFGGAA